MKNTLHRVTSTGSWPHAHVLLASAGLSLLGLAGLAGAMFLVEHRRLKRKRPIDLRMPLPSLEALAKRQQKNTSRLFSKSGIEFTQTPATTTIILAFR